MLKVQQTQQSTLNLKILSFRVYSHLKLTISSMIRIIKKTHSWRKIGSVTIMHSLGLFQDQNHRWPLHLNLGKPSKNHWFQWLICKKKFNGDGPLKNHWWQWCLGKKPFSLLTFFRIIAFSTQNILFIDVFWSSQSPLEISQLYTSRMLLYFDVSRFWCNLDLPKI